ncbi:MAG: hypothetical protein ABJC07_12240 [Acidobacteriota bacterium]
MSPLAVSFAATGALLLVAGAFGTLAARALHPGADRGPERTGWGICLGLSAVGLSALIASLGGPEPRLGFAMLAVALLSIGWFSARQEAAGPPVVSSGQPLRPAHILLQVSILAGVLFYTARALIRPMGSIDFLAIWGLKGRSIFSAGAIPAWLSSSELAGFSHPEYPLGLPLLYAGIAGVVGTWDDHAMALLFPVFQIATLLVLYGWLRRRGTERGVALTATTLLALFEPLYSGFLTGMADVPLSLAMLLLGTALSDAIDGTDRRALFRLAVASLLASSLKNEGLFLSAVAAAVAILSGGNTDRTRRFRVALAAAIPAIALTALVRAVRGAAPLRDFDFGLISPSRFGELLGRVGETISIDFHIAARAWILLPAIALLLATGVAAPWATRQLGLAAAALAVYLALPAFAVLGPVWLAETTLFRTAAALAPLAAAGIAGRFAPAGSARDLRS